MPEFLSREQLICTPNNKYLFGKFMIQQWVNARNALGLDSYTNLMPHIDDILNRVNGFTPLMNIYFTTSGRTISYAILWKCASDGIILNMHPAALKSKESPKQKTLLLQVKSYEEMVNCLEVMKDYHSPTPSGLKSTLQHETFTFVRDPFQRFIAGFTEAVFRTLNPVNQNKVPNFDPLGDLYRPKPPGRTLLEGNHSMGNKNAEKNHHITPLHTPHHHNMNHSSHSLSKPHSFNNLSEAELEARNIRLVNTSIVAKYLRHVFDYDNRLVLPGHFFPMSGVLFSFPIQNLGHLESFDEDWNRILTRLNGGQPIPYDYKFGMHKTSVNFPTDKGKSKTSANNSKDPNNARVSLLKLMKEDLRYTQAICHLILVDYICLPSYTMPVECQFLNQTREAAIAAVHAGQILKPYQSNT